MSYNRELDIEEALNCGEEILKQRPELYEMDCQILLNKLDDETGNMIHNRWGVAAWIAVKNLHDFDVESLAKKLPESYGKQWGLISEYVGYLLQWKYQVHLDLLLLEAQKQGVVDQIEPFAASNLRYGQHLDIENVPGMLGLLEQNKMKDWYFKALCSYAELVGHTGQQYSVAQQLRELSKQAEYELIHRLGRAWYQNEPMEVEQYIRELLEYTNPWSQKAGIDLIEESLFSTRRIFEEHFHVLCRLADSDRELWNYEVALWVRYALRYKDAAGEIKTEILERLHTLPDGSIEEKLQFVNALQFENEITEELQSILDQIQFADFQKDSNMLKLLDQYYWRKMHDNPEVSVFNDLQKIFQANRYSPSDYRSFFTGMPAVTSMLHHKSEDATVYAIDEMVHGGWAEMIFGTELFSELGNLKKMPKNRYSEKEWIRVMRAVLYLMADSNRICKLAFQFLELMENSQEYLDFCMDEVYENFPWTMQEQAKTYQNFECTGQRALAGKILERAEQEQIEYEIVRKIRDL